MNELDKWEAGIIALEKETGVQLRVSAGEIVFFFPDGDEVNFEDFLINPDRFEELYSV